MMEDGGGMGEVREWVTGRARVVREASPVLDEDLIKEASKLYTRSTILVSLTFALFHYHVAFPKCKGAKQLSHDADALKSQLVSKGTWQKFPKALTTAIEAKITDSKVAV